jgi:hypothetical protein
MQAYPPAHCLHGRDGDGDRPADCGELRGVAAVHLRARTKGSEVEKKIGS